MKRLLPILPLLLLSLGCARELSPEGWEPEVYGALRETLDDKSLRGSYAVFDCDNTSILHDVTHTLMLYQIENLRFADAPSHLFLDGLPGPDVPLKGLGLTTGEMGSVLRDEYLFLRGLMDEGKTLEEVHRTPEYKDFRARFLAFYSSIGKSCGYAELCFWLALLSNGMSEEETLALGRESLDFWLSQGRVWSEEWVSPDGRFRGEAQKGIIVPEPMKNLYKALDRAGIRPYICSASPEWLVELLACDKKRGFGLDTSQVFGLRTDPLWPRTFKEGKIDCIERLIAPRHAGRCPALVAGDSEGDIAMLTAWRDSLRTGLIMDLFRGGEISALARSGAPYVAQPVVITREQALRLSLRENPYRSGGCYHSYEAAPDGDTPAPHGYKAFYISHYGRHGSRYHTAKMMERCNVRELQKADSLGKLTPCGKDVLERMLAIRRLHEGREGTLSERGVREHEGIAERMALRFPSVFAAGDSVSALSTGVARCNRSMRAFTGALPSVRTGCDSSTANLNVLAPEFFDQKHIFSTVSARQKAMRAERFDATRLCSVLFTGGYVPSDPQQLAKSIYMYGCIGEDLDIPGKGGLLEVFTPEELFTQWSIYSDVIYGELGGSVEYGWQILPSVRPLLERIVNEADSALASPGTVSAHLRFGHDNGLVPLVSLMGLEDFTARTAYEGSWRAWPSFANIPMASNLQMVFYRNRRGNVLVKLLYNEKETRIPALESFSGPYYRWEELKAYLMQLCSPSRRGPQWLNEAVIYQIYPSSFKDSDADGIGDIRGIISKLDYIRSLGVTAVWFSPMFESSWYDGGYDIIDFYRIDPRFGTNADLEELVAKAHEMGLKVMLDLVAGHTSDKCPWFLQSAEGPGLKYSDYYIWSDRLPDAKAEAEFAQMMADPNFMQSNVGNWMKSSYPRNKYYCKNFFAHQPSLNYGYADPDPSHPWEQPVDAPGPRAVRQELRDILAFWYERGIDGFRVDMASSLVKNDKDKRETIKLWQEIRRWQDFAYPGRVLISEWNSPKYALPAGFHADMFLYSRRSAARALYEGPDWQDDGGCYFSLDGCKPAVKDLYGNPVPSVEERDPAGLLAAYYARWKATRKFTDSLGYFASITGNHDNLRFNLGRRNSPGQLKVTMAWVLTMPLPILYYGDEIGLRSLVGLPSVEGSNIKGKERAGGRTPMQWDASPNAGFSDCPSEDLYLPVCPEWTPANTLREYREWRAAGAENPTAEGSITVESQQDDPASLLNWTKALIALRRAEPAFWAESSFEPVFDGVQAYPMVYLRSDGASTWLVALNPTGERRSITLDSCSVPKKNALSSGETAFRMESSSAVLDMGPVSVYIAKIEK